MLPLLAVAAALSTLSVFAFSPPSADDADKAAPTVVGISMDEAMPSFERMPAGSEKSLGLYSMQDFFARYSDDWQVGWDAKSGRPNIVSGAGIPLLPGRGNALKAAEIGARDGQDLTLQEVAGLLRGFIAQEDKMLQVSNDDLVLDSNRSVAYGERHHFWSIEFQQTHQGVPVDGAHVFFRVNHGNIVQFGANRVASVHLDATPSLSRKEALARGLAVATIERGALRFLDARRQGELKIIPVQGRDQAIGEKFLGPEGLGYDHVLVWEFEFLLADDHGYRMRVDAHSGEVRELIDRTVFAEVSANVYPVTNSDPLTTVQLPFVSVSNSGTRVTDASGNYTYSGGTASSTLSGRYTNINDSCGSISLSNSTDGNLDFGGAGGTDCTTPGFGGSGNTHSARTGHYHLTNINRTAAAFLPSNSWLDGTLTANMNLNANCNAFWNGSTVNFYTSGGGCANTGEIAAVFLHEWGHGMDSNAGGSVGENGTGEAVGDSFAFIELRDPCIGENFLSSPCFNCNSTCTGVRDVSAYAIGGVSTISRPDTVEANAGMNCDQYIGAGNTDCPYRTPNGNFPYQGPMGYEGHCESYIASSANWDLAQLLIGEYGTEGGWGKMEELWYGIMTPMGSAYQVVSGGQCNPSATVNGCGASNWYTLYLAADDDDGNLSNGTPNGCRIWDAFDAHGIACGARPACSVACSPTAVADAGADQTLDEGDSVQIGTAAQSGHTYSWSPGGFTSAQPTVSPTTTTTYTVTATTSCGSDQDSVTVTVIPAGSNGPQNASYDSGLGAPRCSVAGSSCDSQTLLEGRGTVGPESNQPNTLDSCTDGTAGSFHSDESNDRIVISTLDGGNFSAGDTVQIDATVWAWTTPSNDSLDLYYAADANNPSWVFITTLQPSAAGAQTLSTTYTLPSGTLQAVRANFRYQGSASSCGTGTYDDTDDLVFAVEGAGNTAPSVAISAPSNGASFTQGDSVTFTGSATDTEDGTISGSLSWSSSLDGSIGSGASFSTSGLSVGSHTVTASVTDSGGLSDSATVNVTIDAPTNNAPTVSISAPSNGTTVDVGDSVTFTGSANDTEDGNLSGSLSWSSSLDGNLGSGASFSTTSLSAGNHTVTASVTDSGGASGTDTVSITVQNVGGGCNDCVDFSVTGTVSYSTQDNSANSAVEDGGDTLALFDNTWRRTTQTYNVTANTVLEFEFSSATQGEIHGIGFEENDNISDATRIFQVYGSQNWGSANHDFDNYAGGGAFTSYTINVGQYYTGNGMFLAFVNDNDAGSGNDSRFRNVRIYESAPPACTVDEDFESGSTGWSDDPASTCSTGSYVLGNPTNPGGGQQIVGSNSGTGSLFTGVNTAAGTNDVDGGNCILSSPSWSVSAASTLSVAYWHGQRDANDDAAGDFFRLEYSTNGGSTWNTLASNGDVASTAAWATADAQIPAGSTVELRVQCSDGSSAGDLVECGIDDVSICSN